MPEEQGPAVVTSLKHAQNLWSIVGEDEKGRPFLPILGASSRRRRGAVREGAERVAVGALRAHAQREECAGEGAGTMKGGELTWRDAWLFLLSCAERSRSFQTTDSAFTSQRP